MDYVVRGGISMIRKGISVLTVVMICVVFSSCGIIKQEPSYLQEQSAEIVRCFDEKDVEGLERLFCQNANDNYDLESEIKKAFEKYEGCSKSYMVNSKGGWAGGYDDGVCVDRHNSPEIESIITDEEKEYNIGFCIYQIYEKDQGRVGISVISLRDSEGNELAVIGGFDWNKE